MSTFTKATAPKPKRPLSGYNLFYRYKRNKVLEATARPDGNDDDGRLDGNDDRGGEAAIRAVLAAVPGLEGVPPDSPVFGLPPARLNEFRAAGIRAAMEGRLFPNENSRSRPHCKVHGVGFVEMSRMMRLAWGRADEFAKDLFGELADVGRVRYRRLMAEYKLSNERPTNVHVKSTPANEVKKLVEPSALNKSARTFDKSEEAAPGSFAAALATAAAVDPTTTEATAEATAAVPSFDPHRAPSSSDPMLEALSAWATRNPPPPAASAIPRQAQSSSQAMPQARRESWSSLLTDLQRTCDDPDGEGSPTERKDGPRPSHKRRASTDVHLRSPVPRQARSFGRGRGDSFEPLTFDAATNPAFEAALANAEKGVRPSQGRRVSTAAELDLCGDSLFEPLPVERATSHVAIAAFDPASGVAPADAGKSDGPSQGRRVSAAAELDLCDASLFEPLPATHKTAYGLGRRSSTNDSTPLDGSGGAGGVADAPAAVATGDGGAGSDSDNDCLERLNANLERQQILLRNSIKNLRDKILRNNSLLPSDMRFFPTEDVVHRECAVGGSTCLETMTPSGPSAPSHGTPGGGTDGPERGEASARDFAEFIDVLDEAIDERGMDADTADETKHLTVGIADGAADDLADSCHSFVFGKPVFDVPSPDFGDKPVSPLIPMPADIELRNNRARMA